ncbi:hypothetical protein [Anaeromicrobium sp.]|uniref:hypothetical protein n=1 Tax=Anaeromicrobium sp. TaxID=1929132 RepID=UPI0025EF8975|nr:hypothetical protein [Anaeromicrobium sp.]
MSFVNERNILLTDKKGNVHNIYWDKANMCYSKFSKDKEHENIILDENVLLEFDGNIDEEDRLYAIYQKRNKEIILGKCIKGTWSKDSLGNVDGLDLFNLNLLIHENHLNIIYCTFENKKDHKYGIYHHYYDEDWKSVKIGEITRQNILNPFNIIKRDEKLMLFFYDIDGEYEEVFVQEFDFEEEKWSDRRKITNDKSAKLCLDTLVDEESLYVTYSKYVDDNLIIKFEKYKLDTFKKEAEELVSNIGTAMHPTLILEEGKLWNVWTEFDKVVSSYSKDKGLTWEGPYEWKETHEDRFYRYEYKTNRGDKYTLNHAFGKDYPYFSFLGFSKVEDAFKVNVKKKDAIIDDKEDREEDDGTKSFLIVNDNNVKIIEDEHEGYEKEILLLKQEVEGLRRKLKEMESQASNPRNQRNPRKRKGIFFR